MVLKYGVLFFATIQFVCFAYASELKTAFVTGVSGQDGTYLSVLLLHKGYQVYGMSRSHCDRVKKTILSLCDNPELYRDRLIIYEGDITDPSRIFSLIQKILPDEIYNLAAESRVGASFEKPTGASQSNALGPLHILEAIRILGLGEKTRFFQASTSELFGRNYQINDNFVKSFYPCSPYAVAKLYAYFIAVVYRDAYNFFAVNGICFNHESPLRGDVFVTKKIVNHVARLAKGSLSILKLGNLDTCRDWGHAKDYVEAMWLSLQQEKPRDYIFATGQGHTVREFTERAFAIIGKKIEWKGGEYDEKGFDSATDELLVEIDEKLFRPVDVMYSVADAKETFTQLQWKPVIGFDEIIAEMVSHELRAVGIEQY